MGAFALWASLVASRADAQRPPDEPPAEPSSTDTVTSDDEQTPVLETVVVGRRAHEISSEDLSASELRETAASTGSPLRVVESLLGGRGRRGARRRARGHRPGRRRLGALPPPLIGTPRSWSQTTRRFRGRR